MKTYLSDIQELLKIQERAKRTEAKYSYAEHNIRKSNKYLKNSSSPFYNTVIRAEIIQIYIINHCRNSTRRVSSKYYSLIVFY